MKATNELIRVATFNIRHGEGLDGRIDISRTSHAIRETRAGLVALQELDKNLERSGRADQPRLIAELTGMEVSFFPTLQSGDGEYGVAIAATGPLEARFESLPRYGREEPRGAIVARWADVSVVATHLSTERAARRSQTERLAQIARGLDPPTVVLGDLNQTLVHLRPLVSAGFTPACRRLWYWHGGRPRWQVDHVLVGSGLESTRCFTTRSSASDHLPMVAELKRTPEAVLGPRT